MLKKLLLLALLTTPIVAYADGTSYTPSQSGYTDSGDYDNYDGHWVRNDRIVVSSSAVLLAALTGAYVMYKSYKADQRARRGRVSRGSSDEKQLEKEIKMNKVLGSVAKTGLASTAGLAAVYYAGRKSGLLGG